MSGMPEDDTNEDANVAQARLLLDSLWVQIEETSRLIEVAEAGVRGRSHTGSPVRHPATRAAQLRHELYQVHGMIDRLNRRFPQLSGGTPQP